MLFLVLLNISIFQGIVLGILLLRSPLFKSKTNAFLAFAVLSLSFSLLNYVLDEFGVYETIPELIFIDTFDSALIFPIFILLYILHLVNHKFKKSKFLYALPVLYLFTLILNFITEFKLGGDIVILICEIVNFLFSIIALPIILFYTYQVSKTEQSTIKQRWIKRLLLFEYLVFGSWLVLMLSGLIVYKDFTIFMKIVVAISTILLHWLCYAGIYKFKIANDQHEIKKLLLHRRNSFNAQGINVHPNGSSRDSESIIISNKTKVNIEEKKNGENQTFTKNNPYFIKLEFLFKEEHIYRNYSIDRNSIAQELNISSGYLSQLVNAITGDNFTTYINKYRVEAVKKMIVNPDYSNYSLLAIGLECGFASKSTFYNTFKKMTGLTPNAYKKQHQ
ncbi:MAG: helix-turn-helix domain-containing protein [Flavobacteriales bacterium]